MFGFMNRRIEEIRRERMREGLAVGDWGTSARANLIWLAQFVAGPVCVWILLLNGDAGWLVRVMAGAMATLSLFTGICMFVDTCLPDLLLDWRGRHEHHAKRD